MADARRNGRNYAKPARAVVRTLVIERKRRGISPHDLADRVGYSHSHMAKLECGQRQPGFNMLMNWADALGFDLALRRKR